MKVRLVAYRRENTGSDTYDLDQFELDLQKEPNVVVNYNWLDLKDPSQRKSSFSQTLKLPFSNANNIFFENYFDVNLDTLVFNAKFKFPAVLYIDSIPQLKGFIQLKSIYLNARLYEVALFGDTADFFTDLKDAKLKDVFDTQDTTDPQLLILNQIFDHKLTLANVLASWTTGLTTVLGTTTNDIMYPVFDYGHTLNPYSSSMFWNPNDWIGDVNELGQVNGVTALDYYGMVKIGNLKPSIRIQRLLHLIASKTGYTIKSSFLGINGDTLTDTNFFSRIFMTLSTENQKVQTVFNTSTGSEAPFIGFEANMTATQSETMQISNQVVYETCFFENVILNNEVYDPNNLFSMSTLEALNIQNNPSATINCPTITFPTEPADEALLPSGNMQIQTKIELTMPATLPSSGIAYNTQINCFWISQTNVNAVEPYGPYYIIDITEAPYESYDSISIINGTTSEYTFINNITPVAGEKYFCVFTLNGLYAGAPENITFTIENCTIQTLQTDEIGLMGGGEEGIVQMRHNMPDISQADFVKDIINKFNLIIKTDADDEKKLLIEPYQDFIAGGSVNYWTDKLDLSKEQVVKTTNELQSKLLTFGDLEDDDILNERYNNKYNIVYGTYKEKRDNDFAKEEFKNFSATSPLIAQGISFWDTNGIGTPLPEANIATAYLFEANEGESATPLEGMKPKLFYYSGTPVDVTGSNPNGSAYNFHLYSDQYLQTSDAISTNNKFPLCTQYNMDTLTAVSSTTKILHYTYYSPNFNTGFTFNYFGNTYSEHGFYYDYYAQYINEIYSDEARIMECYVNLSPTDIQSFAGNGFKNTYFIKNCLWRVISIDNYLVGGDKSTKVTLLKVIEKLPSTCNATPSINADTGLMTWTDNGTGAATTITNECCEEQNDNWTFIQTNATTGVGQCYATGGNGTTTTTNIFSGIIGGASPLPALMPNITSNNMILSSTGYAQTMNFVLEATTNGTSTTTFNFGGVQKKVFLVKFLTISFIKIKLLGTVKNGTNYQKAGYFEYDTVLGMYYGGLQNIGGTTLLKTNKDSAFTTPTLNITTTDEFGYWQPTITGGVANEVCNWICEVSIISKSQNMFNTTQTKAIYQNAENILMQNLDYLLWN